MDTRPRGPGDGGRAARVTAELAGLRELLAASGLGLGTALCGDPAATAAGPGEAAAAVRMTPGRRRDFLAGRLAARRALRSVGLDCGEIPRAGRLPVFPPGWAASVTHSGGVAVAVARALPQGGAPPGCDLELNELPLAAARLVLGPGEAEWLGDAPARLLAVFSAKEAAWKSFRRTSGTLRDLRAVPAAGGFRVHARDDGTSCARVRVHVLREGGVFSWVRG